MGKKEKPCPKMEQVTQEWQVLHRDQKRKELQVFLLEIDHIQQFPEQSAVQQDQE